MARSSVCRRALLLLALSTPLLIVPRLLSQPRPAQTPGEKAALYHRSPVDLVITPDGKRAFTANQTSHSVSMVDLQSGKLVAEAPCGRRPSGLALTSDGKRLLVSGTFSGEVSFFDVEPGALKPSGTLHLGFEPRGIVIHPDGRRAFVALTSAHAVAEIDINEQKLLRKIAAGKWPRYIGLSPDGKRLAVPASGDGGIGIFDVAEGKLLFEDRFTAINFGQVHVDAAGKYAYVPWMVYRHNPITQGNIREGWVLASRIARVKFGEAARREAIALDARGLAVSDPHGLALSPDENWMVCTGSGTHELLVYRTKDLPWQDYGGPGDHIDGGLLVDKDRFFRIPLGGRPMAVRFLPDGKQVAVANYLLDAVQIVDLTERKVTRTIPLGGPEKPDLARRGEAIFFDGQRSLDQWYSCHSCHYEGHANARAMDTRNDGSFGTFKTVLSLRGVTKTPPYFWHGWEKDLRAALRKSMKDSMLGKDPTAEDLDAVVAFLATLERPANPYRDKEGRLSDRARRGEKIFHEKAACASCHRGENFTDGRVHDVGTRGRNDVYKGYNPPSLLGIHDRILYLHDGRAESLEQLLRGPHSPERVNGAKLTEEELQDLFAYVRSL